MYQPLTLLDCLHTFCGACLKEWFQFQASTATSIHPYTCPSCRATVVKTQRNASVTTLLDVFLKANPSAGKSEEDKRADQDKYKPGDNVLPKLRRRDDPAAEEDRRLLEEVQQLSLREVGITATSSLSNNTLEPPRERRRRERSRDGSRSSRTSRRDGRGVTNPRDIVPPRHVEHQSSLRSLLSASELDSQEVEEEIMRQIMEEGLLDGIDLDNIDRSQEDEITERIAQAYRARQEQKRRERRERRERMAREGRLDLSASGAVTPQDSHTPSLPREEDRPRRRPHGRSESGTSTPTGYGSSRPPLSRPTMIEAANQGSRSRHPRSSSQGSSRSTRRGQRPAPLPISSSRHGSTSSVDVPTRGRASTTDGGPTHRRQSDNQQRSTLAERQQFRDSLDVHIHSASASNSPRRIGFNVPSTESPPSITPPALSVVGPPPARPPPEPPVVTAHPPTSRRVTDPTSSRSRQASNGTPPVLPATGLPRPRTETPPTEADHPAELAAEPVLFTEPSIHCQHCGKEHIEYEVYYNCARCDNGDFNICLACYRASKGCKHWYGFGWAAMSRYERKAPPEGYPPDHERPHILVGRRYRRPATPLRETSTPPHVLQSEDDPAQRLDSGVFCDICKVFANDCYWKCDVCNEGAWGYCNDCVNQGRHCTHPLMSMEHAPQTMQASNATSASPGRSNNPLPYPEDDSPLLPPHLTSPHGHPHAHTHPPGAVIPLANTTFRQLTFTTLCNLCSVPIPSYHMRYHCLRCNHGDYDLCGSCYHKQVSSGRISKEDGPNGWCRCPRGHRMVIVGFEDRGTGERRVVVKDLVGGHALKDVGEEEAQGPRSPTGPGPVHGLGIEHHGGPRSGANWSWRDTDGSIHQYRTPQRTQSPQGPSSVAASLAPSSSLRFPPSGGVGLRVQALWGHFPAEDLKDELTFPRNAEIREAEDINGDWLWGVYAGRKGLFPANYGRVIGGGGG